MATSERFFHLQHVTHQPFRISFLRRIAFPIALAPSMEPLDG